MENNIQASGFVIQPRLHFKNIRDKLIYQMLVEEANYVVSKRCGIGQTIIVLTTISKETGWTRDMIKGSLDRLAGAEYIQLETLPQKRGILVTVSNYKDFQNLTFYQKDKDKKDSKKPQENPHEIPQENTQENPHEGKSETPCGSKEEVMPEKPNPQENPHDNPQERSHEIPHTITAFITSLNSINSNITLKEYLASAKVKSMNLTSTDDIEIFVDFALRTNAFPEGTSRKILITYFDSIRLTRSTCNISANLLANLIEKMAKYSVNQINYALWMHCEKHDDKRETYTLGILRNTKEPEARRGLMLLKNKNGGESIAAVGTSTPRNDEIKSKIDAANERRKKLAGIESNRNTNVPF